MKIYLDSYSKFSHINNLLLYYKIIKSNMERLCIQAN